MWEFFRGSKLVYDFLLVGDDNVTDSKLVVG